MRSQAKHLRLVVSQERVSFPWLIGLGLTLGGLIFFGLLYLITLNPALIGGSLFPGLNLRVLVLQVGSFLLLLGFLTPVFSLFWRFFFLLGSFLLIAESILLSNLNF